MKNLKKLSREELKTISGGVAAVPSGFFKCCVGGACSSCVLGSYYSSYCLTGVLTSCG